VSVHPHARCGACGGRTDLEARCYVCWQGWITSRPVDRLLANGVEINADAQETDHDRIAVQALSRLVRRFGVRRVLLLMSEGASTMIDLAKEPDTGVEADESQLAALHALARGLARAPEGS
jgi:hypothetical protein